MKDHTEPSAVRSVRGPARCAVTTLALAGAAWAARAVWQIRLAAAGQPSSGPPEQGGGRHRPLTALENTYHFVSSLGDAATVLCAIAFLMWLSRARDNARALSGERPRRAWPWVYAGWIVPVVNLWVPRGIVVDIHRASAPGERLPRVVNWWWGLWLAGSLSGVGLMYTESADGVIARAYTDLPFLLTADTAVVGAAVAGVLVVRTLTGTQRERLPGTVPHRADPVSPARRAV
ncbi:DUF4328 domain-containing protein [Streptomyces sp. AM 4-1-1]|uniref:DUF4328 domain-containing protein n=1 Tax=Streptomyces sp. AM 4-1-1 TaxID=3028710 RepID=UPI0023B910F6|nr:DUF4328 domain-containing protein [Streptomyces sp. AM 4-1-1]WEH32180.1 DUF4328 domain-containing protein [Streptomyces sp. AM 4-1-1]